MKLKIFLLFDMDMRKKIMHEYEQKVAGRGEQVKLTGDLSCGGFAYDDDNGKN